MYKKIKLIFFALTFSSTVSAQDPVMENFKKYVFPYLEHFRNYGEEHVSVIQLLDTHYSPGQVRPGDLLQHQQDSLCAKLRVKQKTFKISKVPEMQEYYLGSYTTNYDEQGRVSAKVTPHFEQNFVYYADSTIETSKVSYGQGRYGDSFTMKYNKNGDMVLMKSNGNIISSRVYNGKQLVSSLDKRSADANTSTTYLITYLPNGRVESIGNVKYTYDTENPNQLATANGKPVIYNLKGQLIESGAFKFNYSADGKIKSYVYDLGGPSATNIIYNEKGQIIAVYSSATSATFEYLESGLVSKFGDGKVKYTYY